MKSLIHFLLSFALVLGLRAQDAGAPAEENPPPRAESPTPADEAYERFRHGTLDVATLAEVLPQLSNTERRPLIRSTILESKTPPRAQMAALLDHPLLAVRLGALELLEELAGGDLSYNPWTPAESPENLAALARWKSWAGEKENTPHTGSIFSEEQRRAYLRDLLAGDEDKATRARRMLEAEGLSAVGFLETFLSNTPTLSLGGRTRIREAQYQITLARQLGDQAAVTARQLAFGSRDQQLSALSAVRGAGMLAIPILRDFITHPDPLVRETAIDSLLLCGGEQAIPVIAPLLAKEPDVNVIHGALRRLKDIPGPETEKLVTSFLSHTDEDLLVSAIQTCLTLSGDNGRFSSGEKKKAPDADAAILSCLSDSRWRIRAAALEYVMKRKLGTAKSKCLALLDDPDDFVRFAAVNAAVALGAAEALPKLKSMLMKDEAMIGPVIGAYATAGESLDEEMLVKLDAAPPEARIAAIRSAASNSALASLVLRYAADKDTDVACAALRSISADDEKLKENRFASVIVTALRDSNPEKAAAIMERLDLPTTSSNRVAPELLVALSALKNTNEPTILDPLYEAFNVPIGTEKTSSSSGPASPEIPAAQAEIIRELVKRTSPETQQGLRFSAAINLAKIGNPAGYAALIRDLPAFSTAQKTAICERLHSPSAREAIQLLTILLHDPVPEVRSAAAECALSNEKAKALINLVLDELEKPDAIVQPRDAYGYRFDYAAKEQMPVFRPWCLKVLQSGSASNPLRILASIAARSCANPQIIEALRKHTVSKDPVLRRAAWHALLSSRSAELAPNVDAIANDPEAFVRVVLPDRVIKANYSWFHHFSDTEFIRDNHSDYNERKFRADQKTRDVLTRMAEQDPSTLVRFESAFALIAQGAPVDLEAFITLLPRLSKDTNAVVRITDWLESNAERATPALKPLLAVIDPSKIRAEKLKILNSRVSPEQGKGVVTFASLAQNIAQPETKGTPLLTEEPAAPPTRRTSLPLVFFHKPGCSECAKTRQYLSSLKSDFPLMEVAEMNILEPSGLVLNQALCGRFTVPSVKHALAPAVFTQEGFVIGTDINPASLGKLLANTMNKPQDDSWNKVAEAEKVAAVKEVDRSYANITLSVVLAGGLLDGINPCAFATIIFFLSYLQIARRTPREMLMVGVAFISAVFIAYLAAGLVLYRLLDAISSRFAGVQMWMNIGFGLLALIAAWLSFRDALRARAGRIDGMTLQLPGILKDRIRGVIRTGARARNFVIAAFISGLVISILELACTGQVYAPIIYQIQKGRLDAVLWLVIYNLAFITPLVIIFLLAYSGLRSETLIAFQKKHTFAVKIGLAILFLALAAFILLGSRMFPH